MENRYLSLDIGGTNIKFGILTESGEILFKDKIPTVKNKDEFYLTIKELAEKYKKEMDIKGVAVSVPGIIDSEKGYTITAGAMLELYNCYLRDELEEVTGLKVSIENDVNCVALAEKWLGNGKNNKNFICLALGTGVGGAIVINNSLYRGSRFMAGEFGFILGKEVVNENSELSTLSMLASTQQGVILGYEELTGKKLKGEEISELYKLGDKEATEVFENLFNYIGVCIINLISSLDPEKVLIGGAISEDNFIMEKLAEKVKNLKERHWDLKNVEIASVEPCKFNNDSGIIGALYNFLN